MKSKICFQWCSGIKKCPPLSEQWITNISLRHNQPRYDSRYNIHFICLFSIPLHMLNSFLSVFIPLYSLQPKFWMILMMRTLGLAWWMKRRMQLLPRSLVSMTETLLEKQGSLDQCKSITSHHLSHSLSLCCHLMCKKKKMLSSNSHQFATVLYCMLYYFAYSISVLINDIWYILE